MLLLKLTGLTCLFALLLSLLLELYFGLNPKPYLFGFPHIKWPLFTALVLIWAVSFKAAYYILFERLKFYG
jgi:hypothetical protein